MGHPDTGPTWITWLYSILHSYPPEIIEHGVCSALCYITKEIRIVRKSPDVEVTVSKATQVDAFGKSSIDGEKHKGL